MDENSNMEPLISRNSGEFELKNLNAEDNQFASNGPEMTMDSDFSDDSSSFLYK